MHRDELVIGAGLTLLREIGGAIRGLFEMLAGAAMYFKVMFVSELFQSACQLLIVYLLALIIGELRRIKP